jgi:hypothetical protein
MRPGLNSETVDPRIAELTALIAGDSTPWMQIDLTGPFSELDAAPLGDQPLGRREGVTSTASDARTDDAHGLRDFVEGPGLLEYDDGTFLAYVPGGPAICVAVREVPSLPIAWRPHPGAKPIAAMLPPAKVAAALSMLSACARAREAHIVVGAPVARDAELAAALACSNLILHKRDNPAERVRGLVDLLDPSAWATARLQPTTATTPQQLHLVLMLAIDRRLAGRAEPTVPGAPAINWEMLKPHAGDMLCVGSTGALDVVTAAATLRLGAPVEGIACGDLLMTALEARPRRLALRSADAYTVAAVLLAAHALGQAGYAEESAAAIEQLTRWPQLDLAGIHHALVGIARRANRRAWSRPWRWLSVPQWRAHRRLVRLLAAAEP